MDAGKIVRYAFANIGGDGGGHGSMAGGIIPKVTFMDLSGDRAIMEQIIRIFEDAFQEFENTRSSVFINSSESMAIR